MSKAKTREQEYIEMQHDEIIRLRAVLKEIVSLDPGLHSAEGYNEWGEADCFAKAQGIAKEALERKP